MKHIVMFLSQAGLELKYIQLGDDDSSFLGMVSFCQIC